MATRPRLKLEPNTPLEHDLQKDCAKMLARVLRPDVAWWSIDHAHSLNMQPGRDGKPIGLAEAQKRVARGCKPGVPDMQFFDCGAAFMIELKRSADEELRETQKDRFRELLAAGIQCKVCWDIWQVFNTVHAWGLCRPGTRVMT